MDTKQSFFGRRSPIKKAGGQRRRLCDSKWLCALFVIFDGHVDHRQKLRPVVEHLNGIGPRGPRRGQIVRKEEQREIDAMVDGQHGGIRLHADEHRTPSLPPTCTQIQRRISCRAIRVAEFHEIISGEIRHLAVVDKRVR